MGLMVHSIGRLPEGYERDFYVYLLDYGWEEPLGQVLFQNFDRMAALASTNKAVVIRGVVGSHFDDEVLSWHHFNGQDAGELLPAIMITTKHPSYFTQFTKEPGRHESGLWWNDVVLLIPLRKCCSNTSQVAELIDKIFKDIVDKKPLADFQVAQEMRKGENLALLDALILEPSIGGIGLDLKALARSIQGRMPKQRKKKRE